MARYKQLALWKALAPVGLDFELAWWSQYLSRNVDPVAEFLRCKHEIGEFVSTGGFDQALKSLELYEQKNGYSIWGVQLRIAILEQEKGIEEQKALADAIAQRAPNSLAAYCAYHASARNSDGEDRQRVAQARDAFASPRLRNARRSPAAAPSSTPPISVAPASASNQSGPSTL